MKILWHNKFWILLIIVQVIWIFNSDGFYFIDDNSHFNFNRHFFENYTESTGAWHRIGRVLLFALPAQFGLKGVQIASAFIFLLTIYFSLKILRHKNIKYAEWVIPVIGFQPVLFNLSYTSLAELPAAFLIVLSYYFYVKGKPSLTLITSSLIFVFRTEYYFVAGLFFLLYFRKESWKTLLLILTGPIFWYIYTTIVLLDPIQFFYDITVHSRFPKIDEGIDWYFYFLHSAKIFGLIQMIFFITAIIILLIKKEIKEYGLILIIVFGGIILQTLFALKGLNLICSIGQLRYVAVVGPMLGIISVFGLNGFFGILRNTVVRSSVQTLFICVMFILGPYSTPFHNKFEIEKVSERIAQLAKSEYPDYKVISNMHQLANAMDEPSTGGEIFKNLNDSIVQKYDKALIVWCKDLDGNVFVKKNVTLKKIEAIPGIKIIKEFKDTVNNCNSIPVYSYRKEGDEYKTSRKIIDYIVGDQTTWETIDIKVFLKDEPVSK